jgi:hypothetical protein
MIANSLNFPMVHKMAPKSRRFASYGSWNLNWLLNQQFWADLTFPHESGLWPNFAMTSPETLYTKNFVSELRFLLVTRTTSFNIQFDRYEFLKSGFRVGQILNRLVYRCLVRFLCHKMGETCRGLNKRSNDHFLSFPTPTQIHISDAHSHSYGHFSTATCGASGLLENRVIERIEVFGTFMNSTKIMTF